MFSIEEELRLARHSCRMTVVARAGARLGHVLGWIGDILGALFVVGGLANYFQVYPWIVSKLTGDRTVYDPVRSSTFS